MVTTNVQIVTASYAYFGPKFLCLRYYFAHFRADDIRSYCYEDASSMCLAVFSIDGKLWGEALTVQDFWFQPGSSAKNNIWFDTADKVEELGEFCSDILAIYI